MPQLEPMQESAANSQDACESKSEFDHSPPARDFVMDANDLQSSGADSGTILAGQTTANGESIWDSQAAAITTLLLLLLLALPLYFCVPLTNDAEYYDLQARLLREGGVLYRDLFEPNLPGVIWLHALVRGLWGESLFALRLFDFALFAGAVTLGVVWLRRIGWTAARAVWFAVLACFFYFSLSEWSYCQRDVWLLLPALLAVTLHVKRSERPVSCSSLTTFAVSMLEGLLWGAAVWLKPHVMVPAACLWMVGLRFHASWRPRIAETLAVLTGGLIAGGMGLLWLWQSGSWAAFWETLLQWNPEYVASGRDQWSFSRFRLIILQGMWPWSLLHLPAIALSLRTVVNGLRQGQATHRQLRCRSMLAAVYLGWTAQAFLLQHLFQYVHVAPLFLALLVLATELGSGVSVVTNPPALANETPLIPSGLSSVWKPAWLFFLILAVWASPLRSSQRLRCWPMCVRGQVAPTVANRLMVLPSHDYQSMSQIVEFLRRQNVVDHQVACFNSELVSVYRRLDLRPPSRFVYTHECLIFMPSRRNEILARAEYRGVRFVVTDAINCGIPAELRERLVTSGRGGQAVTRKDGSPLPFPFNLPVVYHSGRYFVHAAPSELVAYSDRTPQPSPHIASDAKYRSAAR